MWETYEKAIRDLQLLLRSFKAEIDSKVIEKYDNGEGDVRLAITRSNGGMRRIDFDQAELLMDLGYKVRDVELPF